MIMPNQKGFVSFNIIAIFLLISALVAGLYLVANRTSLRSLADSTPKSAITLESKYLTGDETTASLVNVQVYADPSIKPDKYRLANGFANATTNTLKWVEYTYPDGTSADQPVTSLWHLNPIPGDQTVYLQFHIADQWVDKLYEAPIKLVQTANPLSISAQCLIQKDPTKSKIVARWDSTAVKALQTEFLWLQLYNAQGTLISEFPNPDLSKLDYTFDVDTPMDNFTLVGIPYLPNDSDQPLDLIKPLGFSEFTTSCDPTSLPHNVSLNFNPAGGYDVTWTGQPGYSAVPSFELKAGFQIYLSADPDLPQPICGSCEVLFANIGDTHKFQFDNSLIGFQTRPGVTQDFTKLIKGRKYALVVTAGAYRIGDKVNFTAK